MKTPRYTSPLPNTALTFILKAFIPYTEANLELAFRPSAFFRHLEQIDACKYSHATLRKAYHRAWSKGYIARDATGQTKLTKLGERALQSHIPKRVQNSCVMVIFDVPETERAKRRYLRLVLRELKFVQTQQSVWTSNYDCADIVSREVAAQKLEPYVKIYEAALVV